MTDRTLGLPNLVAGGRSSQLMVVQRTAPTPGKLKTFFNPIYSFMPFMSGRATFKLWPGGAESAAPVNLSRSYGGVMITPELALQLSAVWACVWRYANTISTLPLELYRSVDGVDAVKAIEHPMYRLLKDRPNSQMSAPMFWQAMIASMMTWGVGYAKKIRVANRTVSLKPLRPEYMTAYMTDQGLMRYRYWPSQNGSSIANVNEDFAAEDLFVIIDRSMDGYTGLSRIQYAANTMGMAVAADRASSLIWKNALRISGILTIAQWLKPDQRAAYRNIVNQFVGTGTGTDGDKQAGVLVAENATKFEPVTMNPHDVELLDSRRFSIEELCRFYDMPPILVGHAVDGQTMWGSGVEQIVLGWLKLGLAPILTRIEKEICRQLLTPEEEAMGYYAEYNLEGLLRGDTAARTAYYTSMTQNGNMTRNEVRSKENLPRSTDANADKLTVQSNMSPLDKLGTMPATSVQVRESLRSFLGIDTEEGDR